MSVGARVLARLLVGGEGKISRGLAATDATLALTAAKCPEYANLRSLDEQEAADGVIELAISRGAISGERTRQGGSGAGFKRLRVVDLGRLAEFLGMPLRQTQVDLAATALAAFKPCFPVLEEIIQLWRSGKPVRGKLPEKHVELLDALRLVETRQSEDRSESILRHESVRLFGDSKRIERLTAWLDVLTSGEIAASGLHKDEIWSQLGLRREPQPMLVSGIGSAAVRGQNIPLCRPFIGLPIEAVESFHINPAFLLTIENLTTFHDTVQRFPANAGLIVYTGGMPSPAWRRLYKKILLSLAPTVPIHHWGDIDEGGYRIAARLSRECASIGRDLQPWLMSPRDVPLRLRGDQALMPSSWQSMIYWANRADWPEIATDLARDPVRIEQEALDPELPA
jgi:Uncharacterized protein conserved in bacteria C-term(DUF2220)